MKLKYSFGLDCTLTVVIWWALGFTGFGLLVALIAGLLLAVKIATMVAHFGGYVAFLWAVGRWCLIRACSVLRGAVGRA